MILNVDRAQSRLRNPWNFKAYVIEFKILNKDSFEFNLFV